METDSQKDQTPQPEMKKANVDEEEEEEEKDDLDLPALSPYAVVALQEYLSLSSHSPSIQSTHQPDAIVTPLFQEDWRLSQFWYSPHTAITLANEVSSLLHHHFSESHFPSISVACISCPTLFIYLKVLPLFFFFFFLFSISNS